MQLTLLVHSLKMSNVALISKGSHLLLCFKTRPVINTWRIAIGLVPTPPYAQVELKKWKMKRWRVIRGRYLVLIKCKVGLREEVKWDKCFFTRPNPPGQREYGYVWFVPYLALPNVSKNWLANFLAKKSSTHTWPIIWQESVREMVGHPLATKISALNQT